MGRTPEALLAAQSDARAASAQPAAARKRRTPVPYITEGLTRRAVSAEIENAGSAQSVVADGSMAGVSSASAKPDGANISAAAVAAAAKPGRVGRTWSWLRNGCSSWPPAMETQFNTWVAQERLGALKWYCRAMTALLLLLALGAAQRDSLGETIWNGGIAVVYFLLPPWMAVHRPAHLGKSWVVLRTLSSIMLSSQARPPEPCRLI